MINIADRKKDLETMAVMAAGFLVLYFIFSLKTFLIISFVLLFIGIFFIRLSNIINKVWTKFAHVLGLINSKIILTIIFFIIVTPIALLRKLFRKFNKKDINNKHSNYHTRDHIYIVEDFEKMW